jgi:hypothetical protein
MRVKSTKSGARKKRARGARRPTAERASEVDSGDHQATPPQSRSMGSPKRLLQAGLNALSMPGGEAVITEGLNKIADSLGFKKLEGVFDQRVASALERLGYPTPAALQRLLERAEEAPRAARTPRKAAR